MHDSQTGKALRTRLEIIIVVAALLLLPAAIAAAGSCPATFGLTGQIINVVPGGRCAPGFEVFTTATGSGSFLGDFTMAQSHCAAEPTAPVFTDGEFVYTSLFTGEELYGTYEGVIAFTPTTPEDGVGVLTQTHWTVTDGTGSLTGATGGGRTNGVVNGASGAFTLLLTGKLKVPAKPSCFTE